MLAKKTPSRYSTIVVILARTTEVIAADVHKSFRQRPYPKPARPQMTAENVLVVPKDVIHQAEFAQL